MGHVELSEEVPHTDPSRKVLDAARERASSGDTLGAANLLRDELASHPDQLSLHDEYRHWLRQSEQKPDLVVHAKKYIPVLIAKGHDRRAMEVVRECQAIDPAFVLDNADDITRLAHAAADVKVSLSLRSYADGDTGLAGDGEWDDIVFAVLDPTGTCHVFGQSIMGKEMQARAMLQQIKLTMPNDPVIPQVDAYIAFLDKLAAMPPKPTT